MVVNEHSICEVKEIRVCKIVTMSTALKNYIMATHKGMEDAYIAFKLGSRDDRLTNHSTRNPGRFAVQQDLTRDFSRRVLYCFNTFNLPIYSIIHLLESGPSMKRTSAKAKSHQ